MIPCHFCKQRVDPYAPTTCVRIEAWERKALAASRRGGSDVVLREQLDDYAHHTCVEQARLGINPSQEALAL